MNKLITKKEGIFSEKEIRENATGTLTTFQDESGIRTATKGLAEPINVARFADSKGFIMVLNHGGDFIQNPTFILDGEVFFHRESNLEVKWKTDVVDDKFIGASVISKITLIRNKGEDNEEEIIKYGPDLNLIINQINNIEVERYGVEHPDEPFGQWTIHLSYDEEAEPVDENLVGVFLESDDGLIIKHGADLHTYERPEYTNSKDIAKVNPTLMFLDDSECIVPSSLLSYWSSNKAYIGSTVRGFGLEDKFNNTSPDVTLTASQTGLDFDLIISRKTRSADTSYHKIDEDGNLVDVSKDDIQGTLESIFGGKNTVIDISMSVIVNDDDEDKIISSYIKFSSDTNNFDERVDRYVNCGYIVSELVNGKIVFTTVPKKENSLNGIALSIRNFDGTKISKITYGQKEIDEKEKNMMGKFGDMFDVKKIENNFKNIVSNMTSETNASDTKFSSVNTLFYSTDDNRCYYHEDGDALIADSDLKSTVSEDGSVCDITFENPDRVEDFGILIIDMLERFDDALETECDFTFNGEKILTYNAGSNGVLNRNTTDNCVALGNGVVAIMINKNIDSNVELPEVLSIINKHDYLINSIVIPDDKLSSVKISINGLNELISIDEDMNLIADTNYVSLEARKKVLANGTPHTVLTVLIDDGASVNGLSMDDNFCYTISEVTTGFEDRMRCVTYDAQSNTIILVPDTKLTADRIVSIKNGILDISKAGEKSSTKTALETFMLIEEKKKADEKEASDKKHLEDFINSLYDSVDGSEPTRYNGSNVLMYSRDDGNSRYVENGETVKLSGELTSTHDDDKTWYDYSLDTDVPENFGILLINFDPEDKKDVTIKFDGEVIMTPDENADNVFSKRFSEKAFIVDGSLIAIKINKNANASVQLPAVVNDNSRWDSLPTVYIPVEKLDNVNIIIPGIVDEPAMLIHNGNDLDTPFETKYFDVEIESVNVVKNGVAYARVSIRNEAGSINGVDIVGDDYEFERYRYEADYEDRMRFASYDEVTNTIVYISNAKLENTQELYLTDGEFGMCRIGEKKSSKAEIVVASDADSKMESFNATINSRMFMHSTLNAELKKAGMGFATSSGILERDADGKLVVNADKSWSIVTEDNQYKITCSTEDFGAIVLNMKDLGIQEAINRGDLDIMFNGITIFSTEEDETSILKVKKDDSVVILDSNHILIGLDRSLINGNVFTSVDNEIASTGISIMTPVIDLRLAVDAYGEAITLQNGVNTTEDGRMTVDIEVKNIIGKLDTKLVTINSIVLDDVELLESADGVAVSSAYIKTINDLVLVATNKIATPALQIFNPSDEIWNKKLVTAMYALGVPISMQGQLNLYDGTVVSDLEISTDAENSSFTITIPENISDKAFKLQLTMANS